MAATAASVRDSVPATIGRAIRLMLTNLGGGIPGIGSATIFATPLRYTACLTENTEQSPWETLACSKGYAPADNVITCRPGASRIGCLARSKCRPDVRA